jgi:Skp family chaperone for outer membrane proteins
MKKYILLFLITIGCISSSMAQQGNDKQEPGERLAAVEIGFLTRKLNLSTEEAQRFWPVYNRYKDEIRQVRLQQKQSNISVLDGDERILNIRKKYNGEFSKALSAEKANNFFRSEKEFGTMIQRELQERRLNRQQNRRPFNKQ